MILYSLWNGESSFYMYCLYKLTDGGFVVFSIVSAVTKLCKVEHIINM
jgi:hypothetical protein